MSKKLGEAVGASNVKPVEIKDKYKVNTITEAQALAARSQKLDVQASYIVTAPFHQLRAMMTVASEAIRIEQKGGNPFSIYNYIGDELPWDEVVTHSQGDLTATREKLVWHEMKRIKTYSAKGDILPVRAILNYMDRRVVRI